MTTEDRFLDSRGDPRRRPALRAVKGLVGAYLGLSILTVAAIIVLSHTAPNLVNPQAWVRGIIVAATSVLTYVFADRAAQGRPRALLRLRIIVAIILVAIVAVVLFVSLPTWMVLEQAACGALLLATGVIILRGPASVATPGVSGQESPATPGVSGPASLARPADPGSRRPRRD